MAPRWDGDDERYVTLENVSAKTMEMFLDLLYAW